MQDNQKNPICVVVELGTQAADIVLPAFKVHRKLELMNVSLIDGAGVVASDSNYLQVELKEGSNVLAEIDTRAAHENGLTQNVGKDLNIVDALKVVAKDSSLVVNVNAEGTVTLTNAKLALYFWQKETA